VNDVVFHAAKDKQDLLLCPLINVVLIECGHRIIKYSDKSDYEFEKFLHSPDMAKGKTAANQGDSLLNWAR